MVPPEVNESAENEILSPILYPSVTEANRLYRDFIDQNEGSLRAWENWLTEEGEDNNSAYITLWKLIEDTIERRERGIWQSNRSLPGARILENCLKLEEMHVKVERVALFTTAPGPSNSNDTSDFRDWFENQLVQNGFDPNHYTPIDLDNESSPILESPEPGWSPPLKINAYRDPRSQRLLYLESHVAPDSENLWIYTVYEDLRDLVPAVLYGRRRWTRLWRLRRSPGVEPLRRYQEIRESIEIKAERLIIMMETDKFREEFFSHPFQRQLRIAQDLLPGLGTTTAGQAFLERLLADDDAYNASGEQAYERPHPMSLDWLLSRRETNLPEYGDEVSSLVLLFNEWLPVLLRHAERRPDLVSDRIARFLALTTEIDETKVTDIQSRASQLASQFRDGINTANWADNLLGNLVTAFDDVLQTVGQDDLAKLFSDGSMVIATIKFTQKLINFYQDPNREDALTLGISTLKFNKEIFDYILTDAQKEKNIPFKTLKLATQFLSLLDAIKDVQEGIGSFRRGEYGAMVGHGLQAIGTAAPIALGFVNSSTGKMIGRFVWLAGPKGKAVAGLIVLGGVIVVMATSQRPLERWFKRNAFGKEWERVSADACPSSVEFRFRRKEPNNDTSGPPNLARQISEFYSLTAGVKLEKAELEDNRLRIVLHLPGYYRDSLVVFRGWNPSSSIRSPVWFNAVPLNICYHVHVPVDLKWPDEWEVWKNSLNDWFEFCHLGLAEPGQQLGSFDRVEMQRRMHAWKVNLIPRPSNDQNLYRIPEETEWLEVDLVSPKLYEDVDRLNQWLPCPNVGVPTPDYTGDEALVVRARKEITW